MIARIMVDNPKSVRQVDEETCTACWALWVNIDSQIDAVIAVDRVFRHLEYTFYPETDWYHHGYRPPENHKKILGAWRHTSSANFVFLLDNPNISDVNGSLGLLIYFAGSRKQADKCAPEIEILKQQLERKFREHTESARVRERLNSAQKAKTVPWLVGLVMGAVGTIINVLSYYFRKLPPPPTSSHFWNTMLNSLILSVHLAALLFVLLLAVFCVIYVVKLGMLMVKDL